MRKLCKESCSALRGAVIVAARNGWLVVSDETRKSFTFAAVSSVWKSHAPSTDLPGSGIAHRQDFTRPFVT